MSIKDAVFSGAIWNFAEQLLRKGLASVVTIVLAWFLTPGDFGIVALVSVFVQISFVLTSSGFVDFIIQKKDLSQEDLDSIFFANIAIAALMYLALFIGAPSLAEHYQHPELVSVVRVAALAIIFSAFQVVPNGLMRKRLLFKMQLQVALPSSVASGVLAIVLAKAGLGVWALVAQMVSASFLTALLYWRAALYHPGLKISLARVKEVCGFSLPILTFALINDLTNSLPAFILASSSPLAVLGLYSFAEKIKNTVVQQIVATVKDVSYPVFSKLHEPTGNALQEAYIGASSLLAYVLFPLLFFFAAISDVLFDSFLPEKWLAGANLFELMLYSSFFYPFLFIDENIFKTLHRPRLVLTVGLFSRGAYLAAMALTAKFGVKAIIIGQGIASFLAFLVYSRFSNKLLGGGALRQYKAIVQIFLCSLVAYLATTALKSQTDFTGVLALFLIVGAFSSIYIGLAALMRVPAQATLYVAIGEKISRRKAASSKS